MKLVHRENTVQCYVDKQYLARSLLCSFISPQSFAFDSFNQIKYKIASVVQILLSAVQNGWLDSRVVSIIDPTSDSAFTPWKQFLLLSNTCQKCTRCLATLYYWISYQETMRTSGALSYNPLDTFLVSGTDCDASPTSTIMLFKSSDIPLFFYAWYPTVIEIFINAGINFINLNYWSNVISLTG